VYRLIEIGELTQSDDEYWQEGRWHTWGPYHGGNPLVLDIPVRRLVKPADEPVKPAPVVSVGDRVKVLTGPWAGCTGVVTGFEVQVSLSGYGKMTALKDSVPVVLLDHVHVGGSQLSVVSPVEKLPPVVPEVLYRDLSHGETTRLSDEMLHPYSHVWHPCHGIWTVDSIRVRRPVRLQSPGWRYLDAGETVQAGDETAFVLGVPWRDAADHFNLPYVVRDENIPSVNFRRKLPTNSGG